MAAKLPPDAAFEWSWVLVNSRLFHDELRKGTKRVMTLHRTKKRPKTYEIRTSERTLLVDARKRKHQRFIVRDPTTGELVALMRQRVFTQQIRFGDGTTLELWAFDAKGRDWATFATDGREWVRFRLQRTSRRAPAGRVAIVRIEGILDERKAIAAALLWGWMFYVRAYSSYNARGRIVDTVTRRKGAMP